MRTSTQSHRTRSVAAAAMAVAAVVLSGMAAAGTAAAEPLASTHGVELDGAGSRAHLLRLPAPSGPEAVGTFSLHLVDPGRRDPWTRAAARELMVSVFYPTRQPQGHPRAPWLPAELEGAYLEVTGRALHADLSDLRLPRTHAHVGAPIARSRHPRPVILYSPGYRAVRELGTSLVEDLASRGYVVVSIDHTHEASGVVFPGGRVEGALAPLRPTGSDIATALRARTADVRLVLDALEQLDSGVNPDADLAPLPAGLVGSLRLRDVGVFGHSLGGDTAAEAMLDDPRIGAGVDLDGSINGTAATRGTGRPFMLMGSAEHTRGSDPSWAEFWSHLRGPRLQLRLLESGHQTFTDLAVLVTQLESEVPLSDKVRSGLAQSFGTVNAWHAVAAQRAYLGAFFNRHLRHRAPSLLHGPNPRFPDVQFIR